MGVIRDGGIINQIYGALNAILPPSHRCIIILLNYKNLIQLIKICLRKLNLKHPKRVQHEESILLNLRCIHEKIHPVIAIIIGYFIAVLWHIFTRYSFIRYFINIYTYFGWIHCYILIQN